jgi:uncharacterized protein (DUF58 family)
METPTKPRSSGPPTSKGAPSKPESDWQYRLPREGWFVLLAAVFLLGIGFFKGINLVMLLGDALLALLILNRLTVGRGLTSLQARRRLPPLLFARTSAPVEVELANPTRRARLGLSIEDDGPRHSLRWFTVRLKGRDREVYRKPVVLPQRGYYTWGSMAVVSGAPFGLVQRRVVLAPGEDVIVLPCLGQLDRSRFRRHLRSLSPRGERVRQHPQSHPAAQAEFHGLRTFRTGDSPRLIHWRTSARRGELMVREFEDVPSENLLLVVDPSLPSPRRPEEKKRAERAFEEVVSLAATICWEWCRQAGDRLTLAVASRDPVLLDGPTSPLQARRVLEALAVLESGAANDAVLDCLSRTSLSPAAVLLIGVGHSRVAGPLEQVLKRPVNCVDAAALHLLDYYEAPLR